MTDIVLDKITSGYNLSKINKNFEKVEDVINDEVLHLEGGNNVMKQDLDMNGHALLNLATNPNEPGSMLTVEQADARYVNVRGDTLEGPLNAGGQAITNLREPVGDSEPARKIDTDTIRNNYQDADANLQAQITGDVPLEASAFSEISWHDQVIDNSVVIPPGKNAWSFGPQMTIAEGQAVTISEGSSWTIADGDEYEGPVDEETYVKKVDFLSGVNLISNYGAVVGVDCSKALIDAFNAKGFITVGAGSYVAFPTASQVAQVLKAVSSANIVGNLVVTLPAGTLNLTEQVVFKGAGLKNLSILGSTTYNTTATSQLGVTGSSKNYAVTLSVSSAANIAVNDYVLIKVDVTGTGDFYCHPGIWKVSASGTNQITVINTHCGSSFPVNTLTSANIVVLKTVLKFSGCDGFRFESGVTPGLLDKVAIVGDYNLSAGTGTTGAHGIIMGSPVLLAGSSSNAVYDGQGGGTLGSSVGVSSFGEQGIAISMRGALVANFVASCSNRKRGIYSEGSHIRCKFSVASGNGEDGFIADTSGMIQASQSVASGNGLNGFWSTNNSLLNASNCKASGNLQHGFESRGLTRLNAESAISLGNLARGYSASYGGAIYAIASVAQSNGTEGYYSIGGGSNIYALNSTSQGNSTYGVRAQYGSYIAVNGSGLVSGNTTADYSSEFDSIIVNTSGANVASSSVRKSDYTVVNPTTYAGLRIASSSIGDISFSYDSTGTGTYTSRHVLKADGTFYPTNDNANSIGRSGNRWSAGYFTRAYIGAGTAFITSGTGSPEGSVSAPVGSVYTRTDGGASTSLYVKETGTGNTGWVAK